MSYMLAIVLPPMAFFTVGKPKQGIVSLILCLTIVGWVPAALSALLAVNQANADRRDRDEFIRAALGRRTLAVPVLASVERRESA